MQETQVWSLGRENPLVEGMATHSSILAWRIPWMEEPGWLHSTGSQRVAHDWSDFTGRHAYLGNSFVTWFPAWTPIFLPSSVHDLCVSMEVKGLTKYSVNTQLISQGLLCLRRSLFLWSLILWKHEKLSPVFRLHQTIFTQVNYWPSRI